MQIDSCHFGIHVHSLAEAQAFYVDILGFEILQLTPAINLLAVRAGSVRISIFADATREQVTAAAKTGGQIIFRTASLDRTIEGLRTAGLEVSAVTEAPGFMKFIALSDPSGNRVEIADYLRDPLGKV
jgi:catechol 2,3-dioxygenase-like lactoylglutathione lyase family enzyme